ncbi:potassium channel family protein [Nocardioides marmotae]|uniref:Two pore domain potassium channel family protein n=1 Tax=Nocardioides marmotae TaxID=2663857 RepID=A0A6I3J220_9ACTN|nr:potassium channel family protein [Nocardioides marmotae]MCR6031482.1 two pore domain potassium channel family protein [Gordonia jinghuaiqii]MBC9733362.1 two pore domain potassium channel family protein [Nocardioides marmotae]MTB84469.1 two pore domain potassium channel family protein [Nocardioides marmotae]MTB95121.1 two pore domain potassium channel family protein [Nocardioides marmotae]QKE02391.1 two pore domain potassium channel family protein [Nocardioides marmotae]
MTTWERRSEWPLVVLALVFLAAYAWPVLDPDLGRGWVRACSWVAWAVWAAFALDYGVRLVQAADRGAWIRRHAFDLVVLLLPLLRPLRLLRLLVLIRVLNRSASASLRGRVGTYVGAGSSMLALVAALAVLDAERGAPEATITSFGDALWWAVTTMTTVGYGDRFPVTDTGRLVGFGLMIAGIALLGTVTATLASWLVQAVADEAAEARADDAGDRDDLHAELTALRRQVEELTLALGDRMTAADRPGSEPARGRQPAGS